MNKEDIWKWLVPLSQRWGAEEALERQKAVLAWPKVVGGKLTHLARPLYVDGATLHLAVPSPVVAVEFRLIEGRLLARLAEVAPESGVRKLRFHVRPEPLPKVEVPEFSVVEPSTEDVLAAERDIPLDLPTDIRERFIRIAAQAHARERAILAAGGRTCSACGSAFLGEGELCPICSLTQGQDLD